jgi:hypothetical protein
MRFALGAVLPPGLNVGVSFGFAGGGNSPLAGRMPPEPAMTGAVGRPVVRGGELNAEPGCGWNDPLAGRTPLVLGCDGE